MLVNHIIEEFDSTDYNGESSLNAVKALSFLGAFYEEQGWKFTAWTDAAIERVWPEMGSEHDEVRAHISELLAFSDKIMVCLYHTFRFARRDTMLIWWTDAYSNGLWCLSRPPRYSCRSAGPRPSTSISWVCAVHSMKHASQSLSRSSLNGVHSVCLALELSSRPMIGSPHF